MKKVAWHVYDKEAPSSEEASHEIVFADTAGKAKFYSQAYKTNGNFTDVKANRVRELDKYGSVDKIPLIEYVKLNWKLECNTCSNYAGKDSLVIGNEIYCKKCAEYQKYRVNEITNKSLTNIEIQMLKGDEKGIIKYGTALTHELNYDWMNTALEELCDMFKYLQCEMDRKKEIERLLTLALQANNLERTKDLIEVVLIHLQKGRES